MLLTRESPLKRAFLSSSCWAQAPVLNEFIVATPLVDVDYSSNVGKGLPISFDKYINCCHPFPLMVAEGLLFASFCIQDSGRFRRELARQSTMACLRLQRISLLALECFCTCPSGDRRIRRLQEGGRLRASADSHLAVLRAHFPRVRW